MSGPYWDEQLETLPVERRLLLREHRLRWQVRRSWDGSPFYRARLESVGIEPSTFGGLADLARIPILHAHDLPRGTATDQPSRAWTVAPAEWWQAHEAGKGGLLRVLTDGDLTQRAHQAARALWAAGTRPGRSLAAMATEVPGETAVGIPNVGPAVAYACLDGEGAHWSDDQYLVEVLDPATLFPVEPGEVGAVVVTDLAREGSPLIRFWTDWEANLHEASCVCGRTAPRSTVIRPRIAD